MKPLERILNELILMYDKVKDELQDYNSVAYKLWHFNQRANKGNVKGFFGV